MTRTPCEFTLIAALYVLIPAVIEVHTVAGAGDLLCRVAARSNEELMARLEEILAIPGVDRTTTAIALARPIPYRPEVLVDGAVDGAVGRLAARPTSQTGS